MKIPALLLTIFLLKDASSVYRTYAEILLEFLAPSVPEVDTEKTVQHRETLFLLPVQGTWRLGAAPVLGAHAFTLQGPLEMIPGRPSPVPLLGGGLHVSGPG